MKKVLSVCLAFALFLGLLPMNVSASEVEYNACVTRDGGCNSSKFESGA